MIHMDIGHPGAKFSGHMNSSTIEQWNFLEPLCIPTILFLNFPFPKQIGIKACVICQHLSVFCWIYIYLPESSHVFNWLGFSQILPKIGRVRSVLLQNGANSEMVYKKSILTKQCTRVCAIINHLFQGGADHQVLHMFPGVTISCGCLSQGGGTKEVPPDGLQAVQIDDARAWPTSFKAII